MPKLQITNAAMLKLYWSYGGELAINAFGARYAVPPTFDQGLADRLGSTIKTSLTSSGLVGSLAASTVLERVSIKNLNDVDLLEWFDSSLPVAGTGTGDPLPRHVALVQTHRSIRAGKSGRGRTYWGGFSETENDGSGSATVTVENQLGVFIAAIKNALGFETMTMCILNRPAPETIITTTINPGQPDEEVTTRHYPARAAGFTDVNTSTVRDLHWDSQRRRNNQRGAAALGALRLRQPKPA